MKKLFSIIFVLLVFGSFVSGQTTKADLERLRKEIGLSASVSVVKADAIFPIAEPLKIYLAVKHNKDAAKDFVNWVEEWNRTNARQFGEIQIVDDLSDADVAAVQYQYGTGRVVREDSVRLKAGKIPRANEKDAIGENDRFVLNGIGNSKARVENSVVTLKLPLYSYLLVRGRNSSWIVDYSRVDDRIDDRNFPELLLQSEIENRLKNR